MNPAVAAPCGNKATVRIPPEILRFNSTRPFALPASRCLRAIVKTNHFSWNRPIPVPLRTVDSAGLMNYRRQCSHAIAGNKRSVVAVLIACLPALASLTHGSLTGSARTSTAF
jgi:hypothetical protein